jgi:hypothetical protein
MQRRAQTIKLVVTSLFITVMVACVVRAPADVRQHRWWSGLGPVLPHDSFPSDCSLCHEGDAWQDLREDFEFDHGKETGVALIGAHASARCLRCHNDRGPVQSFAEKGCAGCHEDVHLGQLEFDCKSCHQSQTWRPTGMLERHSRTRFPLVGVHAATACRRCHVGAELGRFTPLDVECVTCHVDDLGRANSPDHFVFGYTSDCHRCHLPTTWSEAQTQ